LLGDYSVFGNAWRLYCLLLIAIGIAQTVLMLAVHRDRARLLGAFSRREFWHRFIRATSPIVAFAIALGVSLAGLPQVSVLLSFVLVPLIHVLARLLFAERPPAIVPAVATAALPSDSA